MDAVTPGLTLGTLYSSGVGINKTKQHSVKSQAALHRKIEATEQQDGAARPGAHEAPDAGAAHDTIDSAAAQVAVSPSISSHARH